MQLQCVSYLVEAMHMPSGMEPYSCKFKSIHLKILHRKITISTYQLNLVIFFLISKYISCRII